MSDYTPTSSVGNNWQSIGRASKKPMRPQELFTDRNTPAFDFRHIRCTLVAAGKALKNNPAAYQRQVLEKSLAGQLPRLENPLKW